MIKCKWCGCFFLSERDVKEHEPECDRNDGGKSDMNYEDIANKYFN
jgi:hypothetical protein